MGWAWPDTPATLRPPANRVGDMVTVAASPQRVHFVGGIRGTAELEKLVNGGKAAVDFAVRYGLQFVEYDAGCWILRLVGELAEDE